MGGKGSGGGNHNLNPANVDSDLNKRSIAFICELSKLTETALDDVDAIEKRFFEYLGIADKYDVRPGVSAFADALGISRYTLYDIVNDKVKRPNGYELTPECGHLIKKYYQFLGTLLETQMTSDKGNPVKYIFLAKNHFGYKDQSERINVNIEEKPLLPSSSELANKYAGQLGVATIEPDVTYELPDGN